MGKYIPSSPLQDEMMMGMPRSAHLNTGGRAVGLSKTFFTGLTEGSSLGSLLVLAQPKCARSPKD